MPASNFLSASNAPICAKLGSKIAGGSHRPSGRNIYSATPCADVTWKDIEWLRSFINVPLLLKGVLNAADASGRGRSRLRRHHRVQPRRPQPRYCASHDRRSPAIAKRVGKRVRFILDGGVRRGIDVFKALALGASAVMIGRPYLYGLAAGGALGVARVVEILRTELEMTMGLAGCDQTLSDLPDFLL